MVQHLDNINVMWILYICSPILYMSIRAKQQKVAD